MNKNNVQIEFFLWFHRTEWSREKIHHHHHIRWLSSENIVFQADNHTDLIGRWMFYSELFTQNGTRYNDFTN